MPTKRSSDLGGTAPTKRPRSSLQRTKNTAWDFAPQPRRGTGKQRDPAPLGLGQGFGSLIVPYEEETDVDEAAAALLAMSCPDINRQEQLQRSRRAPSTKPRVTPPVPKAAPTRRNSVPDASFQFPAVHGEAQTTLPVYPRLIISSKSNASDESSATNLELKTAAGGSTESIQSTGELIQRSMMAEARASGLVAPLECIGGGSVQNLGLSQQQHPRSQALQVENPYLAMGAAIGPVGLQVNAAQREWQAVPESKPSMGAAKPGGLHPAPQVQAKDSRLATVASLPLKEASTVIQVPSATPSVSQPRLLQPTVKSRGGRLVVLPDAPSSPDGHHGNPPSQQHPGHNHTPTPWQAPVVLAKATQPKLQTSPTARRAGSGPLSPTQPKHIVMSQPRLVTVKSEPGLAPIPPYNPDKGKKGAPEAAAGGAQEGSGEESSEEAWQPNWGLTLFSALNPNVITTGLSIANQGRSTSQPLDAK